ncbi:NADPH oxidase organizer 1-like [Sinocyclocheilus anshuiensis]|uniref:NADPH oxidase organizer 1-like n=1 Tax=Sinocyclocheilus anshuiensis TaxID=1608454 RepID=A0A671N9H2_9TELE|nr:PREDICTED: NADPH oxidase organizer 1-like [Sinocyclocheilus anshuiensis]XP_016356745.1 PREDICTED: NADPH oxidase organizer 1-like [Sinocyclocheilus anshuiensis]
MSDPRFPVEVRVIGVMKKGKDMFMTSVLWSDQSDLIVYRSFRDFKTLHRQLKKKFPVDNYEDRVLPRFGAQCMVTSFQLKGLAKSVSRLRCLEKYCSSLLQCDTTVSHSSEVIKFFLPTEQQLLPEYTQNSVMILQSDNINTVSGGPDLANKRLSNGNVTQPFVSKTYRCVAPYETKDTKNRPFKVTVDERLDVLIKDKAGWWLAENEDKCLAWFPAPYLELCDEEEDEDEFDSTTFESSLYCVTRSYTSKKEDELSLSIGAVVEVLQRSDNGWWLVRYNRKVGYVPSMYLKLYSSPSFGLQTLQRKLHSFTIHQSANSSLKLEPQVHSRSRMNSFLKSNSLEMLSEPVQHEEAGSFSDDGTDFSFSSSDTTSMSPSMSSSEWEEGLRQQDKEPDSNDSGMSSGQSTPTSSDTGHPMKGVGAPRVPPRPQTQEILRRCTTYTRKAALATSARLAPESEVMVDEVRV